MRSHGSKEVGAVPGDPEVAPSDRPIFEGLAVIEVATNIAGRLVGVLLAELGASVLAVEDAAEAREPGVIDAYYRRGKQVERIDLASGAGRGHVLELVAGAAVVVVDRSPAD